jgi:hypothetical protein
MIAGGITDSSSLRYQQAARQVLAMPCCTVPPCHLTHFSSSCQPQPLAASLSSSSCHTQPADFRHCTLIAIASHVPRNSPAKLNSCVWSCPSRLAPCQPKLPVLESRYLVTYSTPQVTLLNQIPQVHARTSPLCSTLPCPDTFYLASPCRGTLNRIPMATCPRYQPTDF